MSFASNNRRRGDAGVTSMEVALTFPLFVMLVFGVIDLSRYFFTQQALTTLVNMTARQTYANAQNPQVPSQAQIASYAPLLDPTLVHISPPVAGARPGGADGHGDVQLHAAHSAAWVFGGADDGDSDL
jgi:Flp pilus assembly protein TadG